MIGFGVFGFYVVPFVVGLEVVRYHWSGLGTWSLPAGTAIVVFGTVALVVRTYLENETLHRELPGYADYAARVRYRLLPGIW